MWDLARHPALEKCSLGEETGDSFLPGHPPDMGMSQGLTEKMTSPISQSCEAHAEHQGLQQNGRALPPRTAAERLCRPARW